MSLSGSSTTSQAPSAHKQDFPRIPIQSWQLSYRRIFSSKEEHGWPLSHGGRFYAPFQSLSSAERSSIEADGVPLVDLDFVAMEVQMMYHLLGLEAPPDPYVPTPEFDGYRPLCKEVLFRLVRISAPHLVVSSIERILPSLLEKCGQDSLPEGMSTALLVQRFRHAHEPLERFFFGNFPFDPANLDSRGAAGIYRRVVEDGRFPILGVHEGFLVPAEAVQFVHRSMVDSYQEALRQSLLVGDVVQEPAIKMTDASGAATRLEKFNA